MCMMSMSWRDIRKELLVVTFLNQISHSLFLNQNLKKDSISQIKNFTQEKKLKDEISTEMSNDKFSINSMEHLLKVCSEKKEIKLKYELEKNVNLVSFEKNRIEISFNENLSKDFVKNISTKLFDWTNERWIITLSKQKGESTKKETLKNFKLDKISNIKKTDIYKNFLKSFDDAELIDVEEIKDE